MKRDKRVNFKRTPFFLLVLLLSSFFLQHLRSHLFLCFFFLFFTLSLSTHHCLTHILSLSIACSLTFISSILSTFSILSFTFLQKTLFLSPSSEKKIHVLLFSPSSTILPIPIHQAIAFCLQNLRRPSANFSFCLPLKCRLSYRREYN